MSAWPVRVELVPATRFVLGVFLCVRLGGEVSFEADEREFAFELLDFTANRAVGVGGFSEDLLFVDGFRDPAADFAGLTALALVA